MIKGTRDGQMFLFDMMHHEFSIMFICSAIFSMLSSRANKGSNISSNTQSNNNFNKHPALDYNYKPTVEIF